MRFLRHFLILAAFAVAVPIVTHSLPALAQGRGP
jgi:hypothetical protein